MSRTPFWRELGSANGGEEKEEKGEGDGRRTSEGAGFLPFSALPSPRQIPSVFCSISKAAGALSSITDKLQERLRLPLFLSFRFLFFFC